MGEKKIGGVNVGTSLVLVTIVLLLIITFATLSYVSAKSDYDLTVSGIEEEESITRANNEAQRIAADINRKIIEGEYDGYVDANGNISYSVDVDDSRVLAVVLHIEEDGDNVTTITRWCVEKSAQESDYVEFEDDSEEAINLMF